jgi:hypothetical protein
LFVHIILKREGSGAGAVRGKRGALAVELFLIGRSDDDGGAAAGKQRDGSLVRGEVVEAEG